MAPKTSATLEIDNFSVGYRTEDGILEAMRGVSLTVLAGESFGLVGESGSGKSTLAMGAIGYLPPNGRVLGGSVRLSGRRLTGLAPREMAAIWGKEIGVVYQNPLTALNPSLTVGRQLAEAARAHQPMGRAEALKRALAMLEEVAMPNPGAIAGQYPHQLSGGMLQRCVIAMGLINRPALLIMDEPTTALDVTTQAVVLDLVAHLQQTLNTTTLYITHDLAVVAKICDRIGVMYAGELMEVADTRTIFRRPRHPYTLSLLGCVPHFDPGARRRRLMSIPGRIPRLDELPTGCIFAPRCRFAEPRCRETRPPLSESAPGHLSACLRHRELPAEPGQPEQAAGYEPPAAPAEVLRLTDVRKDYSLKSGFFQLGRRPKKVRAVDGVSLDLKKGFTLGVVGESGCGKTTLMRTIMGLLEPTAGSLELDRELLQPSVAERPRQTLRKLQMVFQNPDASLNPRRTVAQAIQRPMVVLRAMRREEIIIRTFELLKAVNLPASYYNRLPAELSGGEKQRVAIARAFAADPAVVLLDEPLSALDVSVQAALINLLFELQAARSATYLFISHDLAAVQHLADWIAVMYLGRIMETGRTEIVFAPPYHPYTEALLSAIPVADPDVVQQQIRLTGAVPSALEIPAGCPFHTRCPRKLGAVCEQTAPPWQAGAAGHHILCHIPLARLADMQAAAIAAAGKGPAR
jgi:peptide/nickel transport system ATP-binding protein